MEFDLQLQIYFLAAILGSVCTMLIFFMAAVCGSVSKLKRLNREQAKQIAEYVLQ